jgi:hypothetical protein
MTKGLKKGLITLSVCFMTFNLLPGIGYAQDEPAIDPGYIQQDGQNAPVEQQTQTDNNTYQDESLFADSTNRLNAGENWQYVKRGKGGYNPYSSTTGGGGIDPNSPPPDPDEQVPFDSEMYLLLIFGVVYGIFRYYGRLKPVFSKF